MAKLTKRVVDAAEVRDADYIIWDDEIPGFGLRVFPSGKRSYLVQYRALGRTRRYAIGLQGVWTPEKARKEAKAQLGRVAGGENPAEERRLDQQAMTIKELCDRYMEELDAGTIIGRSGRPKSASTIDTDKSRITRHIVPLIGTRRLKDITTADVVRMMKDIMAGKTRRNEKTKKKRGRSIVKGGPGTAARTVGVLGGIFTYAKDELGIDLPSNPAHGIRKPKDRVRNRRLSHAEYRILGKILVRAEENPDYAKTVAMIRLLAMTGCRRGEIIKLQWDELDAQHSSLCLRATKTGDSVRPIGLPALELIEERYAANASEWVFPGERQDGPFGSFPNQWKKIFKDTELNGLTAHVLRHSFASLANDMGFTEVTVAALLGHSHKSITSRYIHAADTSLIMAADAVSGVVDALLHDVKLANISYALDRTSRRAAMDRLITPANDREPVALVPAA